MIDSQDRGDLEEALSQLHGAHTQFPDESSLTFIENARQRIEMVLYRKPEIKNPVGGNIDVTTKDKGQIIDTKV